jgi:penicillin-binding protein 2
MAGGALIPLLRISQLTTARGDELLAKAESRLITERLIPTTRGRILDRKDRVLALDVPSFDIAVDYPLISGSWAFAEAARLARKQHASIWRQIPSEEREKLIMELVPQQQDRLAKAWSKLADLTGTPLADLETRRAEITGRVSRMAAKLTEASRRALEAERLERGRELTVSAAEAEKPIREQVTSHIIIRGLSDQLAFEFPGGLLPQQADDLTKTAEEANAAALTAAGLLPGMRLVDGTRREYPAEMLRVSIDRSFFPGPLRSSMALDTAVPGVATPIVGQMRSTLYREDVETRPLRREQDGVRIIDLSGYAPGDSIGQSGAERLNESVLRGQRGIETQRLETGQKQTTPPQPGRDVRLTLDAALQARIQALLSPEISLTVVQPWHNNKAKAPGTLLPGAVVVMDVRSSQLLALASTPTWTRAQLATAPESILVHEADQAWLEKERSRVREDNTRNGAADRLPTAASLLPFLNRSLAKAYAPGSIVKPIIIAAAASEGLYRPGEQISCTGHLYPSQPNRMRCWLYKQFSMTHDQQFGRGLTGPEATMVSCNIFFFTLGQRLGPQRIVDWYQRFGIGEETAPRLGLGFQFPGAIGRARGASPSQDDADELAEPDANAPDPSERIVTQGEAALLGIGQGPIAWTPLHAASAYATLGRIYLGLDEIRPPSIIQSAAPSTPLRSPSPSISRPAVREALEGLRLAVSDSRGTGHHIKFTTLDGVNMEEPVFNIPGVTVWGKSGTADSGVPSRDNPGASLDHSWFVVLVGRQGEDAPLYAVAVLVENGGSGGRVAGPLCNQVLWALRAEGYL